MSLLTSTLPALPACILALFVLLRARRLLPLDHPNARSLHSASTPRIGGLGMVAGAVVAWSLQWPAGAWPLVLPASGLVLLSLLDDYLDLSTRLRLLAHLLAAGVFLAMVPVADWRIALGVFLGVVWMSNLYNFMDGADGLAGGMALFGFGAYALLAWLGGDVGLSLLCATLAAAALGFLVFNFPPARLFMGDAGSVPLGFLAAAVGLIGWQRGLWPALAPLLIFSPFIVDASVTLGRRALRGERVWQAHREHYYQRLVRMGWSHRRLALSEYAVMAAAAASAIVLTQMPSWQGGLMWVWMLAYGAILVAIDRRWRAFEKSGRDHAA